MSMVNSNHISALCGHESHTTTPHNSPGSHRKPIRLKNVCTKAEAFDALHLKCSIVSHFSLFIMYFKYIEHINISFM